MPYFSGQGRVYIGARDTAGNPQGLNYVGNVPELKVSLSVETLEHQESTSGQRLTDLQLIKTKKGEFACTLEELISVNLPAKRSRPSVSCARNSPKSAANCSISLEPRPARIAAQRLRGSTKA